MRATSLISFINKPIDKQCINALRRKERSRGCLHRRASKEGASNGRFRRFYIQSDRDALIRITRWRCSDSFGASWATAAPRVARRLRKVCVRYAYCVLPVSLSFVKGVSPSWRQWADYAFSASGSADGTRSPIAVHDRHLNVHQHQIIVPGALAQFGLPQPFRFPPGLEPAFLEHRHRDFAVEALSSTTNSRFPAKSAFSP